MQIIRIVAGSGTQPSAEIVGAKAANLARIAALGLPVPPAFALPIELCASIVRGDADARSKLAEGLTEGIKFLEETTGTVFGDRRRPLLVSVRSGAARSMPGMLDTVLNVGCSPPAVRGLARMTGNPRFAHDCRRRFLESYGHVVLGIKSATFAAQLSAAIAAERVNNEQALDCEALERLTLQYQRLIEDEEYSLAENPMQQLEAAAEAVYHSWMSDRARSYRKIQRLDDLQGTAVTVQAMVFGNSSTGSGAGVAFSRDPSTGADEPVIDVLFGSQGEDVVSGGFNPETEEALSSLLPGIASQLREALKKLEEEFGDVQDVEFTIEHGKLWLLQTRAAKRTPYAAVRFAIDLVNEGKITSAEALLRLKEVDLGSLAHKRLLNPGPVIARGIGASAGIAIGRAAFDAPGAERLAANDDPVIFMRPDTNTSDVAGFAISAGIVTAVGGRTAHAALVARQLGKPCIVGCTALNINMTRRDAQLAGVTLREGDWLSIDGSAGAIYLGSGTIAFERPEAELAQIDRWRASTRDVRSQTSAAAVSA
jgi:pyruvate, orthophosphate dikinase